MKVWQTSNLVDAIAVESITEKQKLAYLLTLTLSCTVLTTAFTTPSTDNGNWKTKGFHILISLAMATIGTLIAFKVNKDNKNTIERITLLSVPILIRMFATILIIFVGIGISSAVFGFTNEMNLFLKSNMYNTGFSIVFGITYYTYLIRLIQKIFIIRDRINE